MDSYIRAIHGNDILCCLFRVISHLRMLHCIPKSKPKLQASIRDRGNGGVLFVELEMLNVVFLFVKKRYIFFCAIKVSASVYVFQWMETGSSSSKETGRNGAICKLHLKLCKYRAGCCGGRLIGNPERELEWTWAT